MDRALVRKIGMSLILLDPFPKAAASYVVAVDGAVIWERNADLARPTASLTKIMAPSSCSRPAGTRRQS